MRGTCIKIMEQYVPKRRHIQFRRRGITQKKEYNIRNTAKSLKSWPNTDCNTVQNGLRFAAAPRSARQSTDGRNREYAEVK